MGRERSSTGPGTKRVVSDENRKTTGTLLRLTKLVHGTGKTPTAKKRVFCNRLTMLPFQTGKVFVLDSGFFVLDALVQLKQCGVFAHELIKKRHY